MGKISDWAEANKTRKDAWEGLMPKLEDALGQAQPDYDDCVTGLMLFDDKVTSKFYRGQFVRLSPDQKRKWTGILLEKMEHASWPVSKEDQEHKKWVIKRSKAILEALLDGRDTTDAEDVKRTLLRFFCGKLDDHGKRGRQLLKGFKVKEADVRKLLAHDSREEEDRICKILFGGTTASKAEGPRDRPLQEEGAKQEAVPSDDPRQLLTALGKCLEKQESGLRNLRREKRSLATQLAGTEKTVGELRRQLGAFRTENARLAEDMQAGQEHIRKLEDKNAAFMAEIAELHENQKVLHQMADNSAEEAIARFKGDLGKAIRADVKDLRSEYARQDISLMIEIVDSLLRALEARGVMEDAR